VRGVNHLRAHAWSPFMALQADAPAEFSGRLDALLPHLGLIVSGGNTLLLPSSRRRIAVLSSTRDGRGRRSARQGAKLLGLGYPGGPLIETPRGRRAPRCVRFPRGIGRRDELDFSFSGLKTSLRYLIEKKSPEEIRANLADLCASISKRRRLRVARSSASRSAAVVGRRDNPQRRIVRRSAAALRARSCRATAASTTPLLITRAEVREVRADFPRAIFFQSSNGRLVFRPEN